MPINVPGTLRAMNESFATVGTSSSAVLAANNFASYRIFINDSAEAIYISTTSPAVKNKGIRINPGGGNYEMKACDGNLWQGDVYAVGNSVGLNLLIVEGW